MEKTERFIDSGKGLYMLIVCSAGTFLLFFLTIASFADMEALRLPENNVVIGFKLFFCTLVRLFLLDLRKLCCLLYT